MSDWDLVWKIPGREKMNGHILLAGSAGAMASVSQTYGTGCLWHDIKENCWESLHCHIVAESQQMSAGTGKFFTRWQRMERGVNKPGKC